MERRTYTRRRADGDYVDEGDMLHEERVARTRPAYAEPMYDDVVTTRSTYWDSLASRVNTVLFVVVLALESLLLLRFSLLAFGANLTNDFVDFVMDVSWPFVKPFEGAFADRTWDEGIVEVNTLLAMGIYFLGFILLALLVNALLPHGHSGDGTIRRRRVTHV